VTPGDSAPSTLEQDYEALLQFLYMAPVGLAQLSRDGDIVLINPLCAQLLMPLAKRGDLTNLFAVLASVAPDLAHRARIFAPLHGKVCDAMHIQTHAGTPSRDAQILSLTLLKLDAARWMVVLDDVSHSVERDRALRSSETPTEGAAMTADSVAYDALIQFLYQAPIGLLQTELDGEITMINPMAASLLMPLTRAGDLTNLFDVLEPFAPELRAQAAAHTGHGDAVGDRTLPIPVGDRARRGTAPSTLGLRLVRLDAQTWMATISDITQAVHDEEQLLQKRLHDLSRSDALTALPNRAVATEHIEAARAHAAASPDGFFAIAFIDLDRFHRINTTHGQAAGDRLLRLAADRLARLVLPGGELEALGARGLLAARLGADEFVVVARQVVQRDAAVQLAKNLVDALGEPYAIDHQPEHVSASVGVVLGQRDAGSADSLLLDASLAMGEAKRAGGAGYSLFDPSVRLRAARRATLENDLRGALGRGDLAVAYQPIVSLASRQCVGMEALVRWNHPSLGSVPPLEFVGIAEETGLIAELGRFVLNEACRACVAWKREFGPLAPRSVSVNVSRAQLLGSEHADHVRQALDSSGLDAAALQVEVTESLAAQDDRVQRSLHDLKALGVTVALDDFGTGYSSLATLHLLPIDVLKIDRSFVMQVGSSQHHHVLIEAVTLVARSLNMRTVAEGIETEEQATALRGLNCDKGQGYLFARPLSREAMTAWLAERVQPGGLP